MADWTSPLPEPAVEGAPTHLQDHDALVEAINEVRDTVDNVEATADGAAPAGHGHEIADVTGLQAALDDLAARVEALEAEPAA